MATKDINDKQIGNPSKEYPLLAYFHDNQMVFLVTHEKENISDNMLERLRKRVESQTIQGGGTVEFVPDLPLKFSFPAMEEGETRLDELKRLDRALRERIQKQHQVELDELESSLREQDISKLHPLHQLLLNNPDASSAYWPEPFTSAFSLVVFNLKKPPDDRLSLLINVMQMRKALKGEVVQAEALDPEGNLETLRIEEISPNWAMSVASNGSGTGGPGGLPTPFQGTDADAKYDLDIIGRLAELYGNGENVDIAILDTAPCPHDLALAPKEHQDNDLIQRLLGPNGKLSLYPATYEDLRRIDNASLNRHDYEMSDHGLFVAGIINSIVPEARIYLIEVLNQWGVGDFVSLAAGLEKAFSQIYQPGSGRRLVVNCSWMLDLPLAKSHCNIIDLKKLDLEKPDSAFEWAIMHFSLKEREQASAIWAICNSISLAGGQVVAAAGNDWGLSKERKAAQGILQKGQGGQTQEPRRNAPEARYPAGFVSVIGVGALPQDSKPAGASKYRASNYSNLGDKPETVAIMTLGGEEGEREVDDKGKKKIVNNGVLGLYLSEKYPAEKNPDPTKYKREFEEKRRDENNENNAWAWWAGTSFATPIVAGTIASLLSVPPAPGITNEVQALVDTLYKQGIIQDKGTDAGEDVMEVTQN